MSHAPAAEPEAVARNTPAGDRRDELAHLLFEYVGGLKRRLMASVPEELKDEFGAVTWHQLGALEQLRAATETSSGATMNEIARMQQCALSSASALVDRVIRLGFAERLSDPEDRRIIHIAPTSLGLEILARFEASRKVAALEALAPLNDDDLERLVQLMGRIVDAPLTGPTEEVAHD